MTAAEDPAEGPCLGLTESRSVARGIEAVDAMGKEAPVETLWTRVVPPGRHLTLITGDVDDVRAALRRARAVLGDDALDELFLPRAHPSLLAAVATATLAPPPEGPAIDALGLIECSTVASTLLAADAAAKQAEVRLLRVRIGAYMDGKGLAAVTGEVSDVESAVTAGASLSERRATLVRAVVIPRPLPSLLAAVLGA